MSLSPSERRLLLLAALARHLLDSERPADAELAPRAWRRGPDLPWAWNPRSSQAWRLAGRRSLHRGPEQP